MDRCFELGQNPALLLVPVLAALTTHRDVL